eukprot:9742172-Alexandrium_andersonii.AAC.1
MAQPEVQCGVGHMCRFGVAVPKSARADGGAPACAKTNPLDELLARDPKARVSPVPERGFACRRPE